MRELLGLLKAIFTDLSGGFHPRRMKNPAEEIPLWRIARDINDYKDLLKMSQAEMSEEQRQALLNDDEEAREANTTLHSFPPSKDEIAGLRQQTAAGEEKQDAEEGASPAQEQETEVSEGSSDPIEDSYFKLGLNEEAFNEDAFDVDLEE